MLDSLIAKSLIKANMPVVGTDDQQLAVVDHVEGTDAIKLVKGNDGRPHYIPLIWVSSVDDKVHLDRTSDQARKQWSPTPAVTPPGDTVPRYVHSVEPLDPDALDPDARDPDALDPDALPPDTTSRR